jgi:hypothetical protein
MQEEGNPSDSMDVDKVDQDEVVGEGEDDTTDNWIPFQSTKAEDFLDKQVAFLWKLRPDYKPPAEAVDPATAEKTGEFLKTTDDYFLLQNQRFQELGLAGQGVERIFVSKTLFMQLKDQPFGIPSDDKFWGEPPNPSLPVRNQHGDAINCYQTARRSSRQKKQTSLRNATEAGPVSVNVTWSKAYMDSVSASQNTNWKIRYIKKPGLTIYLVPRSNLAKTQVADALKVFQPSKPADERTKCEILMQAPSSSEYSLVSLGSFSPPMSFLGVISRSGSSNTSIA